LWTIKASGELENRIESELQLRKFCREFKGCEERKGSKRGRKRNDRHGSSHDKMGKKAYQVRGQDSTMLTACSFGERVQTSSLLFSLGGPKV
jgi:hypothetical protein